MNCLRIPKIKADLHENDFAILYIVIKRKNVHHNSMTVHAYTKLIMEIYVAD